MKAQALPVLVVGARARTATFMIVVLALFSNGIRQEVEDDGHIRSINKPIARVVFDAQKIWNKFWDGDRNPRKCVSRRA